MTSMFLATLLAAAQASTAPATLEVTEPRNAAVGFALTTSLGVERMARACSAVPDVAPRFEAASQAWLARNKPYADAAHGWLEHVKGLIAADQGAGVAEAFIANTHGVLSDEASMLAAQALPGSPPSGADCLRWADILDGRRFDMERSEAFSADLRDVRAFIESTGALRGP